MLPVLFNRSLSKAFDNFDRLLDPVCGMDAWEEGDKLFLRFEMPGYDKEGVSVVSEDGSIIVTAKREEKENRKYLLRSSSSSYSRSLLIPDGYDAEKASATYENGILTVSLEKMEGRKNRIVQVK